MEAQVKENFFEWILSLDPQRLTLFFSLLARELTISFRAYSDEDQLDSSQKMKGLYAFNQIQHRILIRILPAKTIGREEAEVIIAEIQDQASRDPVLAAHVGAALNASKKTTLQ